MSARRRVWPLLGVGVLMLPPLSFADGASGLQHNPFDKPQALLSQPVKDTAPVEKEQRPEPPILKGTLVSADSPMVVLEDGLLQLGDVYDGFRLVDVMEGAAVFEHEGERFRVAIGESDNEVERR